METPMPERPPAVAGSFYEGTADGLRKQVDGCFAVNAPVAEKEVARGAVVPHAGLMYSGHVAATVYDSITIPSHVILLGPNHTGMGNPASINSRGSWRTPFGSVHIDEELAAEIMAATPLLTEDVLAHAREHSLEVQLPFLQTVAPATRFVPLCLSTYRYEQCEQIGQAIATVVRAHREREDDVFLLASSDLNHYESQQVTLRKDHSAIDRILAMDPRGLWDVVREEDISMCGIIPTTTMLIALRSLGATEARLLKHATSGDINGDYAAVVGYAGIIIR
jgi:AmmeMemoRadiSam system protein B